MIATIAWPAAASAEPPIAVIPLSSEHLRDLGLGKMDLDEHAIAMSFYAAGYDDVYDTLVVWPDFDVSVGGNATTSGLYVGVSSDVRGLNLDRDGRFPSTFDFTERYGSAGYLKGMILLSPLDQTPEDPYAPAFGLEFNVVGLLGQETLHRFGAFVDYSLDDALQRDLLGRSDAHWSFFFHSAGSDLEGNRWIPQPDGTYLSGTPGGRFNHLDQYLMGLRLPDQVTEELFLIRDPQVLDPPDSAVADSNPREGVRVRGQRQDIDVEMIIDANGPRLPSAHDSPKTFNQAFILLTPPGVDTQASLEKIDRHRRAWTAYFYEATDARGRLTTTLDKKDDLPLFRFGSSTEGFVVTGASAEASITLDALTLTPTATAVQLEHDGLAVNNTYINAFDLTLEVQGVDGVCSVPGTIAVTTDSAAEPQITTFEVAPDGQRHTYTLALDDDAGAMTTGLALTLTLPEASVGEARIIVHEISGNPMSTQPDADKDGVLNMFDNCPRDHNPAQADLDGDGIGDVCGDPLTNACGAAPPPTAGSDCSTDCTATPQQPPPTPIALALLIMMITVLGGRTWFKPS